LANTLVKYTLAKLAAADSSAGIPKAHG